MGLKNPQSRKGRDVNVFQKCFPILYCGGLYDGVFFDAGKGVDDLDRSSRLAILQAIRAEVHDDFLIIMNTNRWRTDPGHAPYVNGLLMETVWDALPGESNYPYTPAGIAQIEDTLLWASENLRQRTVNLG